MGIKHQGSFLADIRSGAKFYVSLSVSVSESVSPSFSPSLLFSTLTYLYRVSCSPGCFPIPYIVRDDLVFLTLLLPPECPNYRRSSSQVHAVPAGGTQGSCMLGEHCTPEPHLKSLVSVS